MQLEEPQTTAELGDQLCQTEDAIAAGQSLDDLGDPEANQTAWDNVLLLQERYDRLKRRMEAAYGH